MVQMDQIEIGMLDAAELPAAISVLARGLRDNPLPTALFGPEPEQRRRALAGVLREAAVVLGWQRHLLIARAVNGAIAGVCGVLPSGVCGPGWRLGPLAVAPGLQGAGVGGALLRVACARFDAAGDEACLETDHPATIALFAHFGFAVTGERQVAGVPVWQMRRHPEPGHRARPASCGPVISR